MARLFILIAVIAIALILWHKISKAKGKERKKMLVWSVIGAAIALLILLAFTGHLNVITAMIAGAVALLPRAMSLLKYLPFINRFIGQQQQKHQQPPPNRGKKGMSKEEAEQVLGLSANYSKEDIIQAHRRMMQKNHPDRGGSDYLAAQINTAKETLLE